MFKCSNATQSAKQNNGKSYEDSKTGNKTKIELE